MKRYPSFSPVPVHNSDDKTKSQFWQILNCARDNDQDQHRTRAEILDLFQDPINGLLKVDGDPFAESSHMPNDLLSMIIALGLLDVEGPKGDDQVISWNKHTEKYMSGDSDFGGTIFNALKKEMSKQTGDPFLLELFIDIWKIMDPDTGEEDQKFLKPKQIHKRLEERGWDSEDSSSGALRSMGLALRYATLMGLFKTDGKDGNPVYARNDNTVFDALRRVCEYDKADRILRILGSAHPAFEGEEGKQFVSDLFVYHLFRSCSGHGRQRALVHTLRVALLEFGSIMRDQYRSDLNLAVQNDHVDSGDWPKYDSANFTTLSIVRKHRRMLKAAIEQKFGAEERHIPKQVSVDVLKRAYQSCQSLEELNSFFMRNAGARYDRTILTELSLSHGGDPFCLPESFVPYDWQGDATQSWRDNGCSGIVAAVTGSGKTIMAIHAISDYINDNPEAVVSVIVPTKVLMYQWAENISELLGLDDDVIGLRGDGFKDSFSEGRRVVVSIVNSARGGVLAADLETLPENTPHMLVADECHRYGGDSNRTVFDVRYEAILGISATPPSDIEADEEDEEDEWTNAEVVIDRIGEVFYNLRYKEALEQELISPFEVIYLSTPLDPVDDLHYDNHTKKIGKAIKGIRAKYGHLMSRYSNRSLDEQLNAIESQVPEIGSDRDVVRYRREALARRELVWNAPNRKYAYLSVMKRHEDEDSQVMVFHEQISQLEDIVAPIDRRGGASSHPADVAIQDMLEKKGYNPAMYHSKQDSRWNALSMDMFRDGNRHVMLSVKALAEGVDVPKADVGIIRVSTGSVRQRIQTIGRMLRKGAADKASIYIFLVTKSTGEPTVDCNILRAVNWDEQLGDAEILHSRFIPPVIEEDGDKGNVGDITDPAPVEINDLPIPPSWEDRQPPAEVDVADLEIGDEYPGRFDGTPIGVDARGRAFLRNRQFGRLFLDDEGLKSAAKFVLSKKGGGKILLTAQGHLITRVMGEPTYFIGTLDPDRLQELENESLATRKERSSNPRTFEEMFGSE